MSLTEEACPKCGAPIDADTLRGRPYRHCLSCGTLPEVCKCSEEVGALLTRIVRGGESALWPQYHYARRIVASDRPLLAPVAPILVKDLHPRIRVEVEELANEFPVELLNDAVGGYTVLVVSYAAVGWQPSPLRIAVKIPYLYPDAYPDCLYIEDAAVLPNGMLLFACGIWRCMDDSIPLAGEYWHSISWHLARTPAPSEHTIALFVRSIPAYLRFVDQELSALDSVKE